MAGLLTRQHGLRCLVCCLAVSAADLFAQPDKDPMLEARRHREETGGFSYIPPEKWKVVEFPGLKYKVVTGPSHEGFATNINVLDETSPAALNDYVQTNLGTMKKIFKKFQLVSKPEKVKTSSSLTGMKFTIVSEQKDRLLRQSFYMFEKGKMKYIITTSTHAGNEHIFDKTFDDFVKTFRFEGK